MASQVLTIWGEELEEDRIKGNYQRTPIELETMITGWLRLGVVTTQDLNQIINLLTHYAAPTDTSPYAHWVAGGLPDTALEVNGQSISELTSPYLFKFYGSTLPDMSATPPAAGFTWVVRNH